MATGLPAGQKLEIESLVSPGVWEDVSPDVLFIESVAITRGRTSQFSQPSNGSMVFSLNNTTGKYTPKRQVLADGVTVHPYWPNIVPRKRVRYSNTPSGVRFLGYIQGWPPAMENGVRGTVQITAYDRLRLLDKVLLKAPFPSEVALDDPTNMWPLTDAPLSLVALELSGGKSLRVVGSGAAPTFGADGPPGGAGTAVQFTPGSLSSGQWLEVRNIPFARRNMSFTEEIIFKRTGNPAATEYIFSEEQDILGLGNGMQLNTSGQLVSGSLSSAGSLCDGNWHHAAQTYVTNFPSAGGTSTLYIDGAVAGTFADPGGVLIIQNVLRLGQGPVTTSGSDLFTGSIAYFGRYDNNALSAARIASHAAAMNNYAGDTTGERIQRFLTVAGLTTSDWVLDPGVAVIGGYPQTGTSVLAACQDMVDTEGGGAVFYIDPTGAARFSDRTFRAPAAPVLTLDAVKDLLADPFSPSFDDTVIANQGTVTRSDASGVLSTQVVNNTASITANGITTDSVTTYTNDDGDALRLEQYRIALAANPGYWLPQIAVDLMTAENNLYASLGSVLIGSRVRLTNLPATSAPAGQLDAIVEGWTETPSVDSYVVLFDLSPADNPPFMIWGGSTDYSRWQASGMTVGAMTNSTTSMTVTTAAGLPALTVVSARYPMNVKVDEEILTITAAPGSSTSPQTVTVTRGQLGTPAAAHAAGSVFNLYPAVCWAL